MKKALMYLGISLTLAFVFAIAYVIVLTLTLPKTDEAYGQNPFRDPFVFPIMATVAVASGLVGWPLFVLLGWRSPPATVAKITGITTLLFILLTTPLQSKLGWYGSYVVCLGALVYCWLRHRNADSHEGLKPGKPQA
ncbi:MAG: hypothetical protein ABR924_15750 [Terracidiphilus sp.]|jgi:uncharacterized BrkB/YihY/UPF0761 family membrane protein